jgi:hypothetical protein
LDTKAYKGVIIGYLTNSYKIWDLNKRQVIISRDVIIIENSFLNNNIKDNTSITFKDLPSIEKSLINNKEKPSLINNKPKISVEIPKKPADFYKDFQEYPDIIALVNKENPIEPNNYKEAISCNLANKWLESMKAEIKELIRQKTWNITFLPKERKPLKGRWVYKIKTNNNNNIIKYKSRYVV